MKTVIYLQTLIVILLFLFHSCSSGEVDKCDKEIITFLPAVSVSTRSTMERGFEEGDKIGIFLFDQNKAAKWKYGSECWVSNIPVEYKGSVGWDSEMQLYWQKVHYTLMGIGYYPYASSTLDKDFTNVYFQLPNDQSNRKLLRQSDFLWASTTDIIYEKYNGGIPLLFNHLFSKLTVSFINTTSIANSDMKNGVQVTNVYNRAIVNLVTREVSYESSISPQVIQMYYDENRQTAEAIIIPQSVPVGQWINFKYKGRFYHYQLQEPLILESGKEYKITIDLSTVQ